MNITHNSAKYTMQIHVPMPSQIEFTYCYAIAIHIMLFIEFTFFKQTEFTNTTI